MRLTKIFFGLLILFIALFLIYISTEMLEDKWYAHEICEGKGLEYDSYEPSGRWFKIGELQAYCKQVYNCNEGECVKLLKTR